MRKLIYLRNKLGISVLVLAHVPKIDTSKPITKNHIAGSKVFSDLIDSAFAIGKSAKDENLRYLKQVKVRSFPEELTDRVLVMEKVKKDNGFLGFDFSFFDKEMNHLNVGDNTQEEDILYKYREGKSERTIAEELNISRHKVRKALESHKNKSA